MFYRFFVVGCIRINICILQHTVKSLRKDKLTHSMIGPLTDLLFSHIMCIGGFDEEYYPRP